MANTWSIELPDGRIWYVGSWAVFHRNAETDAQVIVPVEAFEDLTDEEIGRQVRALADYARWCNAAECAEEILNTGFIVDQNRELAQEYRAKMAPFTNRKNSERIWLAIDVIDGKIPHPNAQTRRAEPKAKRNGAGYIYLLKSETGYYKIGYTKDMHTRMKAFGVHLPFKVELLHTITTDDMYTTEQALHQHFAHCRANGEWFALTDDEVAWITSHSSL